MLLVRPMLSRPRPARSGLTGDPTPAARLLSWVLAVSVIGAAPAAAQGPTQEDEGVQAIGQVPDGEAPPTPAPRAARTAEPFGANLFTGNFAAQREDGVNPDYHILPGDRVAVNAWGAITINGVFAVDAAGNIFLPEIGPIRLAGVTNAQLNQTVRSGISRIYRGNFDVYTHLLNASPVAVFVTGGVQRPGRYAGIPSDSILFFLDQAGGIHPELGSYRRIKVMREGNPVAELDLYDFLVRGTLPTPQFVDGDTILVERRGPVIEVRGAVGGPTLVELTTGTASGQDLADVVASAARAHDVTLEGVRGRDPFVRTMPLEAFMSTQLQDGDRVTFREEGRPEHIVVHLEGEFTGPSTMTVRRGSRLLDMLNYVPVDPELANTSAAYIRRVSVAEQQFRSLNESLDRLERSTLLALSDSQGEAAIRAQEAALLRQFVERARNVRPLGRVVTSHEGREMNVLLEDEDVVVIPPRTNVVNVSGEVQVIQAVMYDPNLTVRDYIVRAGGYTNRAETGAVIVVRQNAGVVIGTNDIPVYPGDEIMVPPRIDHKIFQNAIDISTVVYQLAVAASVILRFY